MNEITAKEFRQALGQLVHGTIKACPECNQQPNFYVQIVADGRKPVVECGCQRFALPMIPLRDDATPKPDAYLQLAKWWIEQGQQKREVAA